MLADFLKTSVMNKLQTRVSRLGVCPYCHKKSLARKHEAADMAFDQCDGCRKVFVIEIRPAPREGESRE